MATLIATFERTGRVLDVLFGSLVRWPVFALHRRALLLRELAVGVAERVRTNLWSAVLLGTLVGWLLWRLPFLPANLNAPLKAQTAGILLPVFIKDGLPFLLLLVVRFGVPEMLRLAAMKHEGTMPAFAGFAYPESARFFWTAAAAFCVSFLFLALVVVYLTQATFLGLSAAPQDGGVAAVLSSVLDVRRNVAELMRAVSPNLLQVSFVRSLGFAAVTFFWAFYFAQRTTEPGHLPKNAGRMLLVATLSCVVVRLLN